MRRAALLAAPLLLAANLARAEEVPLNPWQVETLLPAACLAANLPTRECLCLADALERHLDFAAPAAVTGDGQTGILPRDAAAGLAIAAAIRDCRPVATAIR